MDIEQTIRVQSCPSWARRNFGLPFTTVWPRCSGADVIVDGVDDNIEIQCVIDSGRNVFLFPWVQYNTNAEVEIRKWVVVRAYGSTIKTWDNYWVSMKADWAKLFWWKIDWDNQTDWQQYLACLWMYKHNNMVARDVELCNAWYYWSSIYECNDCIMDNVSSDNNFRHWFHPWWDIDWTNLRNIYINCSASWNWIDWFNDRTDNTPAWWNISYIQHSKLINFNWYNNWVSWVNIMAGTYYQIINNLTHNNWQFWFRLRTCYDTTMTWNIAYDNPIWLRVRLWDYNNISNNNFRNNTVPTDIVAWVNSIITNNI